MIVTEPPLSVFSSHHEPLQNVTAPVADRSPTANAPPAARRYTIAAPLPAAAELSARAARWGALLVSLVVAMAGMVLLVILNSGRFTRDPEEAPIIFRPPLDPLARHFVYFFALAPNYDLTLSPSFYKMHQRTLMALPS